MNQPDAILFVDDTVRPLAEKMRALSAELASLRARWYGGINGLAQDSNAIIEDGRLKDGVTPRTCGDLNNFMTQALKTAPGEPGAWNPEVIEKFCVRGLKVS